MFAYIDIGVTELVIVPLTVLISFVLPAWLGWKVASRAGLPGALGLLALIPMGILLFLFAMAFLPWPYERTPETNS